MSVGAETQLPSSSDRSRRLLWGIGGSIASRAAGALAPLILIPLTLSYLGTTYFGLWMTVVAAAAFAAFADLGLGNGLMTRLPQALADDDHLLARRLVSSAYAVLVTVALGVVAALWLTAGLVPWTRLFDPEGAADATTVELLALVAFTVLALNVPCSLVTRIYYANQRAASAGAWQALAGLAPLAPVSLAIWADAGPVAVVTAAVAAGPFVNVVNTVWCFVRVHPELRPQWSLVTKSAARDMLLLGTRFFALTVALVVANNSDNLIVTQAIGLTAVALFAVPARAFLQLGQVVSLVNIPLWSASADALARGDVAWIRRTTRRMSLSSTAAVLLLSLPLVLFGEQLMALWTGQTIPLSRWLTAGFALWWLVMAALSPLFMVQNGAGIVIPQLLGWSLYAAVSVPAKYLATASVGTSALPWVGVALLLLVVAPSAVVGYRRALRGIAEPTSRAGANP